MSQQPIVLPYEDPAFTADPFPFLNGLRERAPAVRVTLATGLETWLITRYEDALPAMTDPRLSNDLDHAADPQALSEPPGELFPRSMLRVDPPDHTRLRRLVSKAFTPRRVAELRPRVQKITDQLLDEVTPVGRIDLINEFALPLPVTVISELLGVPADDRDRFQGWTETMLTQQGGRPDLAAVNRAFQEMHDYLQQLITDKRVHPDDDLLSALIVARDQDQRLTEDELVTMAFLLLVAGYVTTVNLIGNGMAALLTHPDQLDLLRHDAGLLPSAVEEFLRYDGPINPGMLRFPTEDIEIAGVHLPRGASVLVGMALANRDPARFTDPDRLDITRTDNVHLAFGHGIHFCLGAPLARLEAEIAFGTLLQRLPDLALAVPAGELQWHTGLRSLKHLPLTFTPS